MVGNTVIISEKALLSGLVGVAMLLKNRIYQNSVSQSKTSRPRKKGLL